MLYVRYRGFGLCWTDSSRTQKCDRMLSQCVRSANCPRTVQKLMICTISSTVAFSPLQIPSRTEPEHSGVKKGLFRLDIGLGQRIGAVGIKE
jgi:hypothetical protein